MLLGHSQLLLEVSIEAVQQIGPALLAIFHSIQLALKRRRVLRIEDVWKVLHQQLRHNGADLRRHKLPVIFFT